MRNEGDGQAKPEAGVAPIAPELQSRQASRLLADDKGYAVSWKIHKALSLFYGCATFMSIRILLPWRLIRRGACCEGRRTFAAAATAIDAERGSAVAASSYEQIYQRKTQIEHILLRPDTYVGSAEISKVCTFIVDRGQLRYEQIEVSPALYKIVDEILVNAVDNFRRPKTKTSSVFVDIDETTGFVSVRNDGKGVPVVLHQEEGIYFPELVFGQLLSGSNFNDAEEKFTGGRNGFGAKLTNVFSQHFTVETQDAKHRKLYLQTWRNNMSICEPPVVQDTAHADDFTRVSFLPDFVRLGMKEKEPTPRAISSFLKKGTVQLLHRRVYDLAACNAGLSVFLNGTPVPIGSFEGYTAKFYQSFVEETQVLEAKGDSAEAEDRSMFDPGFVFSKLNERWEVAVGTPIQTPSISFVNSISTARGGSHVQLVTDLVARRLADHLLRKHKLKVSLPAVKQHFSVFVNALVPNPVFDSQTKETLTTKPQHLFLDSTSRKQPHSSASVASSPPKEEDSAAAVVLSDSFFGKLCSETSIVDRILAVARSKQLLELDRSSAASGGSSRKRKLLLGIEKLDDANLAGIEGRAAECTLILTEGDSAKALAVAGLSEVGRDLYGVYPLKGKFLNVRDANVDAVIANKELSAIKTILGLQHSMSYATDVEYATLRYGRVMLMCDQDHDGSHIKGLFINMLHFFWPALLQRDGFLVQFVTPLLKAFKGKSTVKAFYSMQEFRAFEQSMGGLQGWRIKYYKGLGTSTSEEGREYFRNLSKHVIQFVYGGPADGERIDLAFHKNKADLRKQWLMQNDPSLLLLPPACTTVAADGSLDSNASAAMLPSPLQKQQQTHRRMTLEEFVDTELIQFSHANNQRAIPHMMDGLKPGQRKILYSLLSSHRSSATSGGDSPSAASEFKVAQLSGLVSERTLYHHGETSLQGTIVNMAQDYVGSGNNLNLLLPLGQFGTRLCGGKDAASARYIFTKLNQPLARRIFRPADDPILEYKIEDGEQVEPLFYAPIIPMVLVNSSEGVGTGYSTMVPSYHPLQVLREVRKRLLRRSPAETPSQDASDGSVQQESQLDEELVPFYRGFQGSIVPVSSSSAGSNLEADGSGEKGGRYVTRGVVEAKGLTTLVIRELPVGRWVEDYRKDFLEEQKWVKEIREYHTEKSVHFEIQVDSKRTMAELMDDPCKKLKLETFLSTGNMHLYAADMKLAKYASTREIIAAFVPVRLSLYEKRRMHQLQVMEGEVSKLQSKVQFIGLVCSGSIVLTNRKRQELEEFLRRPELGIVIAAPSSSSSAQADMVDELLSLPLSVLTAERKLQLEKEYAAKMEQLEVLRRKTAHQIWLEELAELEALLAKYYAGGDNSKPL